MFWDSSKSTYLPAPAGAEQETQQPPAAPSEANQEDDNQSEGRKDKNKMAKKVGSNVLKVVCHYQTNVEYEHAPAWSTLSAL